MLTAIEYLGGVVLVIFLANKTALTARLDAATVAESVAAARRRSRLIAGSLAIAVPLGLYLNRGFPDVLSAFPNASTKTWVYCVGIPLLLIVLILLFARLEREFVD
jgi:hypothetical protein